MSDTDADVDDAGDEDLPEIEDDEFADVDLDGLADEVEEEAGADSSEDTADQDDVDADRDGADDLGSAPSGESWGDMYVGTLTTVSNALIEEHGTESAEPIEEELARQLHLDQHFDDWMATRGKSEMPPEQALLLGTSMFMITVIGTKTEIPSKLLEEADF